MIFRFAKLCDVNQLSRLHHSVRHSYNFGVFSSLDYFFLKTYYKVLVEDVNSLIICGEHDSHGIIGFCSASLDVKKYNNNLKKNKLKLAFAAIPSILKNPRLLINLISRLKSLNSNKVNYITTEGARLEYWVWSKNFKNENFSLHMHESMLNVIRDLGKKKVSFEVDLNNKNVYKFHKLNGAIVKNHITLDDKRERVFLEYDFKNRKSKFKYNI